MSTMNRYIAILLFGAESNSVDRRVLYREDVVLIHAPDPESAVSEATRHARSAEHVYVNGAGERITERFHQLVDVAPLLDDDLTVTSDLYSRHFRDIDAYRRFDPLLDGESLSG